MITPPAVPVPFSGGKQRPWATGPLHLVLRTPFSISDTTHIRPYSSISSSLLLSSSLFFFKLSESHHFIIFYNIRTILSDLYLLVINFILKMSSIIPVLIKNMVYSKHIHTPSYIRILKLSHARTHIRTHHF